MIRNTRLLRLLLLGAVTLGLCTPAGAAKFKEARIYIEYNDSANDLGFHVSLDAEDWRSLRIVNPLGRTIFEVEGEAAYRELGMTELFFEGAEPSLDDFPLADLLALFPEGRYRFIGVTVDGGALFSSAMLSHAIPEGPAVSAEVGDDTLTIRWESVDMTPVGFPQKRIDIVGYQVIVESFQLTLPASIRSVMVPAEFVEALGAGEHAFEVLAIDAGGAQSITEGVFTLD